MHHSIINMPVNYLSLFSFLCFCFVIALCIYSILLFYDFSCLRSSSGSIFSLNQLDIKLKENKLTDFQTKLETTLYCLFCTQIETNLTFRVDLWSKRKVYDSSMECPIFANLVSKYPLDLGWKHGELACVRGGGGGGLITVEPRYKEVGYNKTL